MAGSADSGGSPPAGGPRPLDPQLRARLLAEARTPWRGLRRGLWLALFASAGVGLATMLMRGASGEAVPSSDWLIQVTAVVVCGSLLWFDRQRRPVE
ncbi:MAG: DUF3493 domain-containing protein [Cyanobacteriota bacterium]|nr:DUF3493 domain-containing protein [Cyanobacteriota bacterium]